MDQTEFDRRLSIVKFGHPIHHVYGENNEFKKTMDMLDLISTAVRSLLPPDKDTHHAGCQCPDCPPKPPPTEPEVMASREETCVKCGKKEIDPVAWLIVKVNPSDPEGEMYCRECTEYKGG